MMAGEREVGGGKDRRGERGEIQREKEMKEWTKQ